MRLQIAQSWWIASELVRRHPHLLIVEHHPMGFYDSLGIIDLKSDNRDPVVDINRPGSVHVHSSDEFESIGLVEALSFSNAHTVVKRVETAARWGTPAISPKTTARSLSYRVIARVLASMVNDRHEWEIRSEWWGDDPFRSDLEALPFAHHLANTAPKLGIQAEPFSQLWVLKRDHSPVAIFDSVGRVVTESGYRELLPIYRRTNRSLTWVIADALGDVLP